MESKLTVTGPILFHLAFPVTNIPETKAYYADNLGCTVGRENDSSVILNLYGHQLVAHVAHDTLEPQQGIYPAILDWFLVLSKIGKPYCTAPSLINSSFIFCPNCVLRVYR
jgi:catechol 2,3-dioxygenase-like lactoylglutathione lyase family enzyme